MKKINLDEYDIDINDESFGLEEAQEVEVNTSKAANVGFEWGHCIISAVVIVVILLTFVFRLVNIDGSSMLPTLVNSDKVIITNFFYEPKVGDIVVIPAGKYHDEPIIKRIIALGGQEVYINYETHEVYVDGVLLEEDYINSPTIHSLGEKELSLTVPEGRAFILGDNRGDSKDSRYFGVVSENDEVITDLGEAKCIEVDDIIGKAQFVIFPFNHFGYLY
ncbi:MAG: signal peptidase I [Clostridia bacterium]|nr:signal peptidase I [Clostridia bacterium]